MNESSKSNKVASPTIHATIWVTISVFVAVIVMACIFKVEVVARGQGKIVPISRVQIVQSEFDGKITAIHIRNGSDVRKGDILIELDATDAEAELNTITAEMSRLRIERARLKDLSVIGVEKDKGTKGGFSALTMAVFDAGLDTKHDFYEEQRRLLEAESEDLQASLAQNASRIEATEKSIEVTQAGIARVSASQDIQKERLKAARDLLERGVSSRLAFLDVQEAFTALEKEREIYLRELDQKRSQVTTLQAERRSILTEQRNRILQRTSEIEARLATLDERYRTADRRKRAARLVAPKDGVVDQLAVFTIGAVARSGEQLLRIVPEDQDVEVEAIFTNTDIGFVKIGQEANINLDAYPSGRFGFVKGVVSDVAADSTEAIAGVWAFEVRIAPDEPNLRNGDATYSIRPGMTATIDITTDKRRIITYFFAPIVETIQSALGER